MTKSFMNKEKLTKKRGVLLTAAACFAVLLTVLFLMPKQAEAAGAGITVGAIDYDKSEISLHVDEPDALLYFSDVTKRTWEQVPGTLDQNGNITMDISWVSPSKNYVINFRKNTSSEVLSVTIPKQVTNFKATFRKSDGMMTFSNASTRQIQWRKKEGSEWTNMDMNDLSQQRVLKASLEILYANGATVYFRLAPVNGSGTNFGDRPSKESSVSIPKKSSAPSVTIDGTSLAIAVKSGMSYRYLDDNGDAGDWVKITKTEDMGLLRIAPAAMVGNTGDTTKNVTIQFRTDASSSKQVSAVTTIEVPAQKAAPSAVAEGLNLSYAGSSTLNISIKAASSTIPYEYTIVEQGKSLDYATAKWTTVNSPSEISIKNTTAPNGSKIYVRKKTVGSPGSDKYEIASAACEISSGSVAYPGEATIKTHTDLYTTAGTCNPDNPSGYLQFMLYSPSPAKVKSIMFFNQYNHQIGPVSFKSTAKLNLDPSDDNKKYIITVDITSTDQIDGKSSDLLFAKITMENDDVIESTYENQVATGVTLKIYNASKVETPAATDIGYSKDFMRVYSSARASDEKSFQFKILFGESEVMSGGAGSGNPITVSSLQYDGQTLSSGDYTASAGPDIQNGDTTIKTAIVKVNVDQFEARTETRDKAVPLIIRLSNGEVLDDQVNITLQNSVKITGAPLSWAFAEGSLAETKPILNADGTVSTLKEDLYEIEIECTAFKEDYSTTISNIKWGNISIPPSKVSFNQGKGIIKIANKDLNKIAVTSNTTQNLVLEFDNGFKVDGACKLTVFDKPQITTTPTPTP